MGKLLMRLDSCICNAMTHVGGATPIVRLPFCSKSKNATTVKPKQKTHMRTKTQAQKQKQTIPHSGGCLDTLL